MTPNEFKAWFDGFTEAFEGRIPTKAQWGRIKERVAEIDGKPITQTVYVDRYVRQYPYYGYTTWGSSAPSTSYTNTSSIPQNCVGNSIGMLNVSGAAQAFNSLQAMADLGRAEASNLAS